MRGIALNLIAVAAAALIPFLTSTKMRPETMLPTRLLLGALLCLVGSWYVAAPVLNATFAHAARVLLLSLIALSIGRAIGSALKLQDRLNALGRITASDMLSKNKPWFSSVVAAWLVTALNPLAIAGPSLEALTGRVDVMLLKAVVDFLSILDSGRSFRLGALIATLPLAGWLILWHEATQLVVSTVCRNGGHVVFQIVCGVLVLSTGLQLSGLRRIRLADYAPSLPAAVFLGWSCF